MIRQSPYKAKCLKCGKTRIVHPKSDAIDLRDMLCKKCGAIMRECEMNIIEKLLYKGFLGRPRF